MIAPTVPTPAPTFTVVNPAAEPTDAWIAAVARLLLADVDREHREGQEHDDHQHQQECQVCQSN